MAYDIPNYDLEVNPPPLLPVPRQSTPVENRQAISIPDILNPPTQDETETPQVYKFVAPSEGPTRKYKVSVIDTAQNPDTPANKNQHTGQVYPHTIKLMLPPGRAVLS